MIMRLIRKFRACGNYLLTAWRAFRHPATPLTGKLALGLLALYVLSPFDLIPDVFPALGWLDDIAVISLLLPLILKGLPVAVIRDLRHKS